MKKQLIVLLTICLVLGEVRGQNTWIFDFGATAKTGSAHVISNPARYTKEVGYGFDFENISEVKINPGESPGEGYCTAGVPFYFSTCLPEGSYEVRVRIGTSGKKSKTTIKAEARRLMVMNYPLKKGETEALKFIVNVRSPLIQGSDSIQLKSREYNYMNWDDRLTLEFSGTNQAVQSIEIHPVKEITTLYLAGNSTVTDQDREPWASWGQLITAYFDTGVSVANYAESGASLASFKGRKRLEKVMSLIQPGDYLFIEFGHNDQKRRGEGIGPWDSFTNLLTEFVTSAREKGANPVLITPTQRRSFDESGNITLTHGEYPEAMRKAAEKLNVPLIDLHAMTKTLYEAWGPEASKKAFVHYPAGTFPGQEKELKDNTHFNYFGAHEIAMCVIKGMIDSGIELKDHLLNIPEEYHPACPAKHKDWSIPESPRYVSKKPDGN